MPYGTRGFWNGRDYTGGRAGEGGAPVPGVWALIRYPAAAGTRFRARHAGSDGSCLLPGIVQFRIPDISIQDVPIHDIRQPACPGGAGRGRGTDFRTRLLGQPQAEQLHCMLTGGHHVVEH